MALQFQQDTRTPEQIAAEAQRLVPIPGQPTSGYAPLPNVASAPTSAAPQGKPVDIFNQKLMELLTGVQSQANNPTLLNERNRLGVQQIDNSMAPAADLGVQNLDPNAALNARQNAGNLYNPEINNLTDRIQASAQAVSSFQNAIESARQFGEDYAKYVPIDDSTIEAVKTQMAAGFLPSADVLDKVGKSLTAADWNALATAQAAKKDTGSDLPASAKEYEYAIAHGWKGTGPESNWYTQWQNEDANRHRSVSNTYVNTDAKSLNADQNTVANIIQKYPATGKVGGRNNVKNGAQWDAAAAEIERVLKVPASTYDFMLQAAYTGSTRK